MIVAADSATQLRLADGDDFPDVLATSRMVALMEVAAARLRSARQRLAGAKASKA